MEMLSVRQKDIVKDNIPKNTIFNLDCLTGMKQHIPDDSIDIIICDPPYNFGKDFGNNSDKQDMELYLDWCEQWIQECIRILKPTGTLYIYGFGENLAFIRTKIDINVRWLVWHYTNKVNPRSGFWQRSHESILACYKETPIFNRDDVREPYSELYKKSVGRQRKGGNGRFGDGETKTFYKGHKNGALPRDVFKIPALSGAYGKRERANHPTQKPIELCKKLIKASRNKDESTLLLVPFAGSGSECVAALLEGIDFIGYEINPDYVETCNCRLESAKIEMAKNISLEE